MSGHNGGAFRVMFKLNKWDRLRVFLEHSLARIALAMYVTQWTCTANAATVATLNITLKLLTWLMTILNTVWRSLGVVGQEKHEI